MKAKVKLGHEYLFSEGASNDWSDLKDKMIINFNDKWTYRRFYQWKNRLYILLHDGTIEIVFPGEVPTLEYDHHVKDQLVLNIVKKHT